MKSKHGWVPLVLAALLLSVRPSLAQMLTGSYVGDGTDNRPISGVGFRPDVVIIRGDTLENTALRSSTMVGDTTKPLGGGPAPVADNIQSLDADGFTLGTNARVNGAGVTYYWTAFKAKGGELAVGSYPGDGSDNRSITGIGFRLPARFCHCRVVRRQRGRQSLVLSSGRREPRVQQSPGRAGSNSSLGGRWLPGGNRCPVQRGRDDLPLHGLEGDRWTDERWAPTSATDSTTATSLEWASSPST